MFHERRIWQVRDATDAATLADDLINHTWTCCQGFRLDGYLFLNDSTSENGVQEYAIVREGDLIQCESVTFGWIDDVEHAARYIRDAIAGKYDRAFALIDPRQLQTPEQHGRCLHCA